MKFLFFVLFLSTLAQAQDLKQDLEKLFRSNPGLVTQLNPDILEVEATKYLKNPQTSKSIATALRNDLPGYMAARASVLSNLRKVPVAGLTRVVVSGQSVTGMLAAAIAAQSGHQVNVYDLRMNYTRDIQWSIRQAIPDILASIDPALAEKFKTEIARDAVNGYIEILPDGRVSHLPPGALTSADPRRVPQLASEMLDGKSVATLQAKKFEKLLYEYLSHHPNVVQRKGKIEIGPLDSKTGKHLVTEFEDVTPAGATAKVYKKVASGHPITIIAEGAGSSSRAALGITSVPASPARLQVAGVIEVEKGGEIVGLQQPGRDGIMFSGSIGTTGSDKRWLVTDIDEAAVTPDPKTFGTFSNDPLYKAEQARLLEQDYKRIASKVLRIPEADMAKLKAAGAIENTPLQTFKIQMHISSKGASGSNVLSFGDATGNGHWAVGGGMHTGAISHAERLKVYLAAVDGGGSAAEAAAKYSAEVLKDSRAWGERSLYYFYGKLSHGQAAKAYQEAIELYFQGKVRDPERALELILPEGSLTRKPRSVRLSCTDIFSYVLGN